MTDDGMKDAGKNRGQGRTPDASFRDSEGDGVFDRALDAGLAKYTAVEPRGGLEDRILANLRAQQAQAAPRFWWRWGLAGVVAALIVVTVAVAWRSARPTPPVAHRPAVEAPAPKQIQRQVVANGQAPIHPQHGNAYASRSSHGAAMVSALPKLNVFPSPQPLTEQEKLLAGFIEKNPEHAALLAEAHMESLRRDAEERRQIAAEDQNSQQ